MGGELEATGGTQVTPAARTNDSGCPDAGQQAREALYASPRVVTDLAVCDFYHTMDIPGYGLVQGYWDLRPDIDAYLGATDVRGKRVLELGTASGFVCFEMETRGADVIAYDLSEHESWDVVPMAGYEYSRQHVIDRKGLVRRLNDGFWLAHRAFGSRSRVVYGDIYSVPETIGPVDVAVFGCILLHVRDPFLALERSLRLVEDRVVVTELSPWEGLSPGAMHFVPDAVAKGPIDTWWRFSPEVIQQFLAVLGFEESVITHHGAFCLDAWHPLFTVVGRRTVW